MPTIIDGYNLIFTCGLEGKSRNPLAIERARERLISTLAQRLTAEQRGRVTIVFDAKRLPVKETDKASLRHKMQILYSVDFPDADTQIEQLIRQHSTPKKLTVVSSDHRLHRAANRRKATAIDSDVWFDQLPAINVKPTSQPLAADSQCEEAEKQAAIKSLESTDWAAEFGTAERNSSPENQADEKNKNVPPDTFNPFPPGYGEDLLG